jgi:nucleotide-binding universal stress UspA family protein
MTPIELLLIGGLGLGLAVFGTLYLHERHRRARTLRTSPKRILFPFVGHALSRRALDAALRLAHSDEATLVPVFLARVPMHMPLDSPLPRQCTEGMPLLETIEQRAFALGVPVDARIERGRTQRHALREAIAHERFDRLVVAAAMGRTEGFQSDEIAWLLDHAPGEVVVIRPAGDDRLSTHRRALARANGDSRATSSDHRQRPPAAAGGAVR